MRELVFGEESEFEKDLGYRAAAFAVDGYRPRDELVYLMYTEVGQQMLRFAMRGDRTMFFLTFADTESMAADDVQAKSPCCGNAFETAGGNVHGFWMSSILAAISILIG
ncbi:MAG: hypothetical protein WBE13_10390 [Candidatus Acidiferrum sp.]